MLKLYRLIEIYVDVVFFVCVLGQFADDLG